ncbi:DUF4214 domain-containing protein [Duganella sp. PWIR1]
MRHRAINLLAIILFAAISGCGGGDQLESSNRIASGSRIQGGAPIAEEDDDLALPNDRAQYLITSTEGGYIITAIPNDGNSRNVKVLRRIQFADTSLALDLEHSGKIYRLYQAAFDRKPDLAGLGYWLEVMDGQVELETIAENFVASTEFQQLYGVNPSDTQFLTKLYNNVLHRAPDSAGLAYWLNAMQQGLSKARALIEFSESTENKTALAPAIENGIAYAQNGVNYRPVASAGTDIQTTTKLTITLDGGASKDANGDLLNFSWQLSEKPSTSSASLSSASTSRPYFVPDVAGTYKLSLEVKDRLLTSRPSTVTVTVSAAQVVPIPDTGIYKCSLLSKSQAEALYLSGHTYLDRDRDGKPCEANDIVLETPIVIPPVVVKQCWVNGYTRKNGTYVKGYWRRC